MLASDFLLLADVIMHPLASSLISLLFVLGMVGLARLLVRGLGVEDSIEAQACAYMTVLGVVSVLALLVTWSPLDFVVLRMLAVVAIAVGLLHLARSARPLHWLGSFPVSGWLERIDLMLIGSVIVAWCLIVTAPPTDADSLDYHLGVPLEMLRNNGIEMSPLWLHAQLIGLGEMLNLTGLLLGTDNLGAFIQLSGILWVLAIVVARAGEHRLLAMKLVVALPVMLFLIPSQKPQLIGSAAIVCAVAYAMRSGLTARELMLSLGALFFAIGIKYSFVLVGGVAWLAIAWRCWQQQRLILCIGLSTIGSVLLVIPVLAYKFAEFGDPLAPLFTAMLEPASYQARFAQMLRGFHEAGFPFPLGLLVPNAPGALSTALGVGALALLAIRPGKPSSLTFVLLAAGCFAVITLLGQQTARFYVEAYLFAVLAVTAAASHRRWMPALSLALTGQLAVVLLAFVVGVVRLTPGGFTESLRDKTMRESAVFYEAGQWFDRVLPGNAVVIAGTRFHALIPRPFLPNEFSMVADADPEMVERAIAELTSNGKPLYVVGINIRVPEELPRFLDRRFEAVSVKTAEVRLATRNPFNQQTGYAFAIELVPEG